MKKVSSKDLVFDKDTLNIFADASTKNQVYGEIVGCAGALACIGEYTVDKKLKIIRDTINNDSEIKAIDLGIDLAIEYRGKASTINLFSDSKLCIYGLREWIFRWVEISTDDTLVGSSGIPISNQGSIIKIINKIVNNDLHINFYHQSGHVALLSNKSLREAKNVFTYNNYITHDVDMSIIKEISVCNYMIDRDTRYMVKNSVYSKTKPKCEDTYYEKFDIDRYGELINRPLVVDEDTDNEPNKE